MWGYKWFGFWLEISRDKGCGICSLDFSERWGFLICNIMIGGVVVV